MLDFRPIFFICGSLLTVLALAMMIPAVVDAVEGHRDWAVFATSSGVTLFVSVSMMLTTRSGWGRFNVRQAFVMTTLAWTVIAAFGSLPFLFSELNLSATDAFFEAMSGVTTTGSTVIIGLDGAPPGILLWRSILQWLGGIGIIVMAVAILPMLQVGGMQMFRVEAFDTDKVLPRAAEIAAGITIIYVAMTGIAMSAMWAAGMSGFDALAHSMTSIATGGFSTHDASIGHFDSQLIDYIVSLTMVAGSVPFVLYLRAVKGNILALFRDSQVQWMVSIMAVSVLLTVLWLLQTGQLQTEDAFRYSTFNVISVMTGTGYATANFAAWGGFAVSLLFFLMFVGGCAGSTTCGIKIFRFQIVYAEAQVQLRRLIQPNGVFIPYYNHRPIPDRVAQSVMGFFFLYTLSFAVLALALGIMGLDFTTAVSGAATAISNVGPGLGDIIGPAGSFQPLPDAAKWLMSLGMLLGRLELFTVLILLSPRFWRG